MFAYFSKKVLELMPYRKTSKATKRKERNRVAPLVL